MRLGVESANLTLELVTLSDRSPSGLGADGMRSTMNLPVFFASAPTSGLLFSASAGRADESSSFESSFGFECVRPGERACGFGCGLGRGWASGWPSGAESSASTPFARAAPSDWYSETDV